MADVKRTVLVDRYSWTTPGPAPLSPSVAHYATRGDVIEVSTEEAQRGESLGALGGAEELRMADERAAAVAAGLGAPDAELLDMSPDELVRYVSAHPDEASRVVALESTRTSPRDSVMRLAPAPATRIAAPVVEGTNTTGQPAPAGPRPGTVPGDGNPAKSAAATGAAPTSTAPAAGELATDDQLGGMSAAELVSYVEANPAERDRVLAAEQARSKPRTTVLALAP